MLFYCSSLMAFLMWIELRENKNAAQILQIHHLIKPMLKDKRRIDYMYTKSPAVAKIADRTGCQ